MPADILSQVQAASRLIAATNLARAAELCRIVRTFHQEGVVVVPLKGPVLAATAYGSVALRQFVDLDLLVVEADLSRACNLLLASGYRPRDATARVPSRPYVPGRFNPFVNDAGVAVDLQCGFEGAGFSFPLTALFWERLDSRPILGVDMTVFPAEETLLLLCIHGWKHRWERLAWICDVAEWLRSHPDLDRDRLLRRARAARSVRLLTLGIALARHLLDVEFPDGNPWPADPTVTREAKGVERRFFAESPRPPTVWTAAYSRIRLKDTTRERAGYLARLARHVLRDAFVPTDEDRRSITLPRWLDPLYVVVRPLRLARTYGRRPGRLREAVGRALDSP
jgi:hypothetical protein